MHIQTIKRKIATILLLALVSMSACLKEKKDNLIEPLDVLQKSNSSIRMFNLTGGPVDVMINNIPLTSFNNSGGATPLGLSIFPSGKWNSAENGSPFTIMNGLLDKNGKAHLVLTAGTILNEDTVLQNDITQPRDYYLLPDGSMKILARQNIPPSRPENFRIRIINMGDENDALGLGAPLSLTWADGSAVSPELQNIASNTSSEYVEIPYGSYQFKLFTGTGAGVNVIKQLAELPLNALFDGCNPDAVIPQTGLLPRVRTFKPGGVYSIVVSSGAITFWDCYRFSRLGKMVNSYRIVTELDPGVNHSYARMHALNAMPGKQVRVRVDGAFLSESPMPYLGSLPYNETVNADYKIFVQGEHTVQAVDEKGTVLAEQSLRLYPYDNYTIWVNERPDGKPGLLFSANDMTSTLYASNYNNGQFPDDGTSGTPRRVNFPYAWQSRFLNLSPDLPYATFTNDQSLFQTAPVYADSLRYSSAYVNIASGVLPERNASILYTIPAKNEFTYFGAEPIYEMDITPSFIRVFRSRPGNPGEIPGEWLKQVAPLDAKKAFIANPQLYVSGGMTPRVETGIYSIALVGRTYNSSGGDDKAKLVVIKHNK
ncbi:hypothetical protein [Chitinophaga barathri]|uniref:DUF4397 domain-containing protein n=1 Tax=Chitinophaga barathri TaxID=1647451 RepID=A0A3N4MRC2_9BACT|nr:hypothetical protein [Chitinophaga barathri]RPD42129.1 hypothetical protein EG028_08280 [Chitinophaga barathri]